MKNARRGCRTCYEQRRRRRHIGVPSNKANDVGHPRGACLYHVQSHIVEDVSHTDLIRKRVSKRTDDGECQANAHIVERAV